MEKTLLIIGIALVISAIIPYYLYLNFSKEASQLQLNMVLYYNREKSEIVYKKVVYIINAKYKVINHYKIPMSDYVYITLPRNTTYQKAYLLSMNPKPIRIRYDEDGNVVAVVFVKVNPGEAKWIYATYKVEVIGYKIFFNSKESKWPPPQLVEKYTRRTALWDTENKTLIKLAYSICKGLVPVDIATDLAKWVRKHLQYAIFNYRLGSDRAVHSTLFGKYYILGDCVEVADVYVTLARIMGIPSRTVFGIILTNGKMKQWLNFTTITSEGINILKHWGGHMWVQVYLPPWGWVDIELIGEKELKIGDYTPIHIIFGIEETKYYGTTIANLCIPSYLTLEYIELDFKKVS